MTTENEAEVLTGVAFNAYQPDGATWGDVARAVAAKAREMDRARGGTQGAHGLKAMLNVIREAGLTDTARMLEDEFAAQGRANAALERERDSNKAGWDDAIRERDEARAQLAARDARIAEMEQRKVGDASDLKRTRDLLDAGPEEYTAEAVERMNEAHGHALASERTARRAAESALATVRQAVEMARPVPLVTDGERAPTSDAYDKGYGDGWAKRGAVLRAAIAATPAEHPDTAALRRAREVLNPLVRLIALAESVHVLPDAAKNSFTLTMRHWRDIAEVLGDSGPSGGGCSIHGPDAGCDPETPGVYECRATESTGRLLAAAPIRSGPSGGWERDVRTTLREIGRILTKPTPPAVPASAAKPTPSPTHEEDWARLERYFTLPAGFTRTGHIEAAWQALARLRDEPRRAAEAMRERCAEYVDVVANEGGIPAVREAARMLAADIRALEVKP